MKYESARRNLLPTVGVEDPQYADFQINAIFSDRKDRLQIYHIEPILFIALFMFSI